VAAWIQAGHASVGIAGGAECLSDVPILHSRRMAQMLVEASKARSLGARLRAFAGFRPRDLIPEAPAIAEPSTGLTMGQSAEKMAKENGITREEQDRIAFLSHANAARATDDGRLTAEMCRVLVPPRYDVEVREDNLLRRDTSMEALAKLPPVFDRTHGTVTAGNSSPLTDGAAAVLLMSEERAKADGHEPLAYIRSWAVAAVDPGWQLLMGPALAIPMALERAGLTLGDMDLIDMHEAFAVQVASNVRALESEIWARERLGRSAAVGKVDRDRLNVCGGSIAVGHPFGATGARITTTVSNELKRRGGKFALISVCAQGGMGFAMVLER
jgi:acetyl-CoA acyltransferase